MTLIIVHKCMYGLELDTFLCMVLLLLAQNVCHTKDKIIEAKEEESQQHAELLKQSQTECENLRIMIKVSIGIMSIPSWLKHINWITKIAMCKCSLRAVLC